MTTASFTSLQSSKERLQRAIDKHMITSAEHAGQWEARAADDSLMLVWSCEEADPRVQAMGPDVPAGFRDSGISADAPWTMWGGDEIVAAAEIGDRDGAGADSYQDKFGDAMVAQWVEWRF